MSYEFEPTDWTPSTGISVEELDRMEAGIVEALTQVPTGVILAFGGASAPSGFLLCQGQTVSRSTYAALFAVLGTAYGPGDGSTTFHLPDLRQRFPLGKAASGTGDDLGESGGEIDHDHTIAHTHPFAGVFESAGPTSTVTVDAGGVGANPGSSAHHHQTTVNGTTDAASAASSGTANPPFQVVNYIVKT